MHARVHNILGGILWILGYISTFKFVRKSKFCAPIYITCSAVSTGCYSYRKLFRTFSILLSVFLCCSSPQAFWIIDLQLHVDALMYVCNEQCMYITILAVCLQLWMHYCGAYAAACIMHGYSQWVMIHPHLIL